MALSRWTEYEWDLETWEDGEIVNHNFFDKMQSPSQVESNEHIVLVCDDQDGRSWAYVKDGKLPEFFLDAYDIPVRKVPKKFHRELKNA